MLSQNWGAGKWKMNAWMCVGSIDGNNPHFFLSDQDAWYHELWMPPDHDFRLTGVGTMNARSDTLSVFACLVMAQLTPTAVCGQEKAAAGAAMQVPIAPVMEAYPDDVQIRLEQRSRAIAQLPSDVGGLHPESVVNLLKNWAPGQTLRVAFKGGDVSLHRAIAEATKDWTSQGNLKLDFGFNAATGTFRKWSTSDQSYEAEIRISFDQGGYWSNVGNDCINPSVAAPNQASLNLHGFDVQRPVDWRGVVLHEFGHAFGFEHEHQHPSEGCNADFRWFDDPGYTFKTDQFGQYIQDDQGRRPGIYTVLGGPPNKWPAWKVDFNLKQLTATDSHMSQEFATSGFDKKSIMKYYFPSWMFVNGAQSHCFSAGENVTLSTQDIQAFKATYPIDAPSAEAVLARQENFSNKILEQKNVPAKIRGFYETKRDVVRDHRRQKNKN